MNHRFSANMPWITYGDASGADFTLPAPEKARFGGERGCERPPKGGTGRDSGGTAEGQWERQWEGQREQICRTGITSGLTAGSLQGLHAASSNMASRHRISFHRNLTTAMLHAACIYHTISTALHERSCTCQRFLEPTCLLTHGVVLATAHSLQHSSLIGGALRLQSRIRRLSSNSRIVVQRVAPLPSKVLQVMLCSSYSQRV